MRINQPTPQCVSAVAGTHRWLGLICGWPRSSVQPHEDARSASLPCPAESPHGVSERLPGLTQPLRDAEARLIRTTHPFSDATQPLHGVLPPLRDVTQRFLGVVYPSFTPRSHSSGPISRRVASRSHFPMSRSRCETPSNDFPTPISLHPQPFRAVSRLTTDRTTSFTSIST